MRAFVSKLVAFAVSAGLLIAAGQAVACNTGCPPPAPPTPPRNPSPPSMPCNCGGGNVNVNVNVKASSSAFANASSNAAVYGGGYGNWSQTPGYPQAVGGLNVVTAEEASYESYSESQSFTRRMVIQASCIDDTGVPHPASQLRKERDIDNAYTGEVYRCIAGTHMQWVYADYDGSHVSFDGGKTVSCNKNEALWFEKGSLTCKVQLPARQCNERSLLRRFGVGVKVLTMTRTETVSKRREVAVQSKSATMSAMTFDGGVGGFVQ